MRVLVIFCSISYVFSILAESKEEGDEIGTKIYADISKEAQENAESNEGPHGSLGLAVESCKLGASVEGSDNFTTNNMNSFGVCLGLGYTKAFQKGFTLGVDVDLHLSKKEKKECSWKDLNGEYDSKRENLAGTKTGSLEKSTPSMSATVKLGWPLHTPGIVIYAKGGLWKSYWNYIYRRDGMLSRASASSCMPTIGLGVEKKVNAQLGASAELNISAGKGSKNADLDGVMHAARTTFFNMRLMATYRVGIDGDK